MTVSRNLKFSKPAGAYRLDESLVQAARAEVDGVDQDPCRNDRAKRSRHRVGDDPRRHEVVVQDSRAPSTGRKADNVSTSYNGASWSSPAGKALTAHDGLGGNLVMPLSSTVADVIVTTTT